MDMALPGQGDESAEGPKYVQAFGQLDPNAQAALVGMITGSPDGADALEQICPELSQLLDLLSGEGQDQSQDQSGGSEGQTTVPAAAPQSARASIAQAMGKAPGGY